MNPLIRATAVACCLQIMACMGMSAYIYSSLNHEAQFFANVAESNARLAAAEMVLQHRNDVQRQFAYERNDMKSYVDRAVEREVSKAVHK